MTRSLSVHNLGPLQNISVDLSADFSVVIGPQASGKSTLGKIIYFCRKIPDYANDFIGEEESFSGISGEELYEAFIRKIRGKFDETFSPEEYSSANLQIHYNYDENDFIHIESAGDYINFQFSNLITSRLKQLFENLTKFNTKQLRNKPYNWNNVTFQQFWHTQLARQTKISWFNNLFHDDAENLYIPAGRGILSALANQFTPIAALSFGLPVRDFIERVQLLKARFRKRLNEVIKDYTQTEKELFIKGDINFAQELIKSILKADYVNDTDGEKLYIDSTHWIRLIYGSSGQQEALWILLFMFSLIMEHKRAFIILEEPEANVYPNAQKDIIKLIALTLNSTHSQILITTHSPYIMTSANVLIHSGRVENAIPDTENTVIPEQVRINPKTTMAYKFSGDGNNLRLIKIRDEETGMFNVSEIDTISETISEETDRLLELEFKYDL